MEEIVDSITIGIGFLDDNLFQRIQNDVISGDFQSLIDFISRFAKFADWDYTDELLERLKELCRFLINYRQYAFVTKILKTSYIIAVFDDARINSECVINYAIKNMRDDDICDMLQSIDSFGRYSKYFFELMRPDTAATNYKKPNTLKLLSKKQLVLK